MRGILRYSVHDPEFLNSLEGWIIEPIGVKGNYIYILNDESDFKVKDKFNKGEIQSGDEVEYELITDCYINKITNVATHETKAKVIFEKTEVGVDVVFDAVGGELGVKALSCLKQKGRMMVFGALALENLSINSGLLIFKNLRIEGFWLSSWIESLSAEQRMKAFQRVFGFLMQDDSKADVAATYPLADFKAALNAYEQAGRNGKILLVSE